MENYDLLSEGAATLAVFRKEQKAAEERIHQAQEEKAAIDARCQELAVLVGQAAEELDVERIKAALRPLARPHLQPTVSVAPTLAQAGNKTNEAPAVPLARTQRKKPTTRFIAPPAPTTPATPTSATAPDESIIADVNAAGYLNKCPIICRDDSGGWVELRCPECGTNCDYTGRAFIKGRNGMQRHGAHVHQLLERDRKIALKRSTHRAVPIEEVRRLATGELAIEKLRIRFQTSPQDGTPSIKSEDQEPKTAGPARTDAKARNSKAQQLDFGDSRTEEASLKAKPEPIRKPATSLEPGSSRKSMKINEDDSPSAYVITTKASAPTSLTAGPARANTATADSVGPKRSTASKFPSYKEAEMLRYQHRIRPKSSNKNPNKSPKEFLNNMKAMKAAESQKFAPPGRFLRLSVPGYRGPSYFLQDPAEHRAEEEVLGKEKGRLEKMKPEERETDVEEKALAEVERDAELKERNAEWLAEEKLKPNKKRFMTARDGYHGRKMARLWRQLVQEDMEACRKRGGLAGAIREVKEERGETLERHEENERMRKIEVSGAEKERRRYLGYAPG